MNADPAIHTTRFASSIREDLPRLEAQSRLAAARMAGGLPLERMPGIVLVLNSARQIVYHNEQLDHFLGEDKEAARVWGLRLGELLHCVHAVNETGGCGTTDFCRVCGVVPAIHKSLAGEENHTECRMQREDGTALDLRLIALPIDIQGERFSILTVQDAGDEKRRQVLERVFFHDILNTASGIAGLAELLQDARPEELTGLARTIQAAANTLIEEISAQKLLSQAEMGELEIQSVPVLSLELVSEVNRLYVHHPVAKGRILAVDPQAKQFLFHSDPSILRRVLANMLKNGLEAVREGQVVTLSCGQEEGWGWFSVHNPTFMERKVQLQVFKRSFSTKGHGRGLGTYGMRLLCQRYLHGDVTFTTSETQGTRFVIRLKKGVG